MRTIDDLREALAQGETTTPGAPDLEAIMRGGTSIRRRRRGAVIAAAAAVAVAVAVPVGLQLVRPDDQPTTVLTPAEQDEREHAGERMDARVQELLGDKADLQNTSIDAFSWKYMDDEDDGEPNPPLEERDLPYVLSWELDYDVSGPTQQSLWLLVEWSDFAAGGGFAAVCDDLAFPVCRASESPDGGQFIEMEGRNSARYWFRRVVHVSPDGRLSVLADDTVRASSYAEAKEAFAFTYADLRRVAADPGMTFPAPEAFPGDADEDEGTGPPVRGQSRTAPAVPCC